MPEARVDTRTAAHRLAAELDYHNTERRHSALNYRVPNYFETPLQSTAHYFSA